MSDVVGWDKSEVLKELLPILSAYGVTYFQWQGLTVSFNANVKPEPKPVPVIPPAEVPTVPAIPTVKK